MEKVVSAELVKTVIYNKQWDVDQKFLSQNHKE